MQTRAAEATVVGEVGVEVWTGGALGTVGGVGRRGEAVGVGVLQWANRSYPLVVCVSCLYCVLLQVLNKAPFFLLY